MPSKLHCDRCGAPLEETSHGRGPCGCELHAPDAAFAGPRAGTTRASSPADLNWEISVPLLTNRFVLYDGLKLFFFTGLAMLLFMAGIALHDGSMKSFIELSAMTAIILSGLILLSVVIMLVFFTNRFPMRFIVSKQGAVVESRSDRGKWANRLAVILGSLSGQTGVAGSGILAMSRETVSLPWIDLHRVRAHRKARVISLLNSWRVVFRLYCTPENFDTVLARIEAGFETGRRQRKLRTKEDAPAIAPRFFVLSGFVLLGGLLLAPLPLDVPPALRMSAPACGLLTIWLPLRRKLFGTLTLAAVAAIAVCFLIQGLHQQQIFQAPDLQQYKDLMAQKGIRADSLPDWIMQKHSRFSRFHPADWATAGMGGLSLGFFTWLAAAGIRGGFPFRGRQPDT